MGKVDLLCDKLGISRQTFYCWVNWNLEELEKRGAVKVLRRRKKKRYVFDGDKLLQAFKELGYVK